MVVSEGMEEVGVNTRGSRLANKLNKLLNTSSLNRRLFY